MLGLVVGGAGILGGAVAALWFRHQAERQRRDADMQRAQAKDLKRQLLAAEGALELERRARDDDSRRLEAVIHGLKVEIREVEHDLAQCASPDAVRARLNRLLAPPAATPGPAR